MGRGQTFMVVQVIGGGVQAVQHMQRARRARCCGIFELSVCNGCCGLQTGGDRVLPRHGVQAKRGGRGWGDGGMLQAAGRK